jgi:hypothetical protein
LNRPSLNSSLDIRGRVGEETRSPASLLDLDGILEWETEKEFTVLMRIHTLI